MDIDYFAYKKQKWLKIKQNLNNFVVMNVVMAHILTDAYRILFEKLIVSKFYTYDDKKEKDNLML